MRKVLMTAALVILLVLPVLAQRRGGGFRGPGGPDMILQNKSVQEELKLDDKQKTALKEISTKQRESMTKAFELFKDGEKDKGKEAMTKATEETNKALAKLREGLTSTQAKRLTEIEVQRATATSNPNIFKNAAVVKILKLTDKQKDAVKETVTELDKDRKEVMEDAGKDREKFKEARTKVQKLQKDAFAKITKSLTEDQVKAWKDAAGEKFEYKENPNPFKGGKGKRGKDKDKDDL